MRLITPGEGRASEVRLNDPVPVEGRVWAACGGESPEQKVLVAPPLSGARYARHQGGAVRLDGGCLDWGGRGRRRELRLSISTECRVERPRRRESRDGRVRSGIGGRGAGQHDVAPL